MKNRKTLITILGISVITIVASCGQDNKGGENTGSKDKSITSGKCYLAVYKGDTALLSIKGTSSGIEGTLKFIKADWNVDNGTIKGTMKGDTLLADYNFKSHDGRWYRNPIALLKKDGKLYLGVGQFETAWGRTYFAKNVPIDYDKGKYVFDEHTCP